MENFILNLLKENSRVIIPEFGAFIIRQQNPPEIAFNSLLTFNDGILTEFICHKSGISFLEASAKVSDYVEKLKADLKVHNRLSFNEIGWIWIDESGEKQFTPWKAGGRMQAEAPPLMRDIETILNEADLTEKSGTEIISGSPVIQTPEQVPFVLDDTLKDVDIDATMDDLIKKPVEDPLLKGDLSAESFSLDESVITDDAAEKLIIPKIDLSEKLQEFQQGKLQADTDSPKLEIRFKHVMPPEETVISQVSDKELQPMGNDTTRPVMDKQKKPPDEVWHETELRSTDAPKSRKEKKKWSWIIPVSAIAAVIILAGAAWLVFPDQVKNILYPGRQSNEETMSEGDAMDDSETNSVPDVPDEQLPAQETIPDMNDIETSVQTETSVVQSEIQSAVKKYYVVAGCFKSQSNAEKYAAELRAKGYNSELFGTHDNLYAVSFNSFTSREPAVNEMNRIRNSTEPKAWILYY